MKDDTRTTKPLVSILIPTYNRRRYLPVALSSALNQDYDCIEVLVLRDGGEDVRDIIESFDDSRIRFFDRGENRGIAYTLNQGLIESQGRYIAYLGNDDLFYPHHVRILVEALESHPHCGVAYSDLYRTYCRIEGDGSRTALSKVVEISRDFDRFLMLYFNHVLHVSMMHRKDLIGKTGFYNESLNVLIDWDLTRRMAFFTDFCHVHEITGEFYSPVGDSDRVSVIRRKNKADYLRNAMTIRTTRPPKPWSKIKDLSIIIDIKRLDEEASAIIKRIVNVAFYPYNIYIPLTAEEQSRFQTDLSGIITVNVNEESRHTRIVRCLEECEGEYTIVIPGGFELEEFMIEDAVFALSNNGDRKEAFELDGSTETHRAILALTKDFRESLKINPGLPIEKSLTACGISVRRVEPEEIPFKFDQLLHEAHQNRDEGDWRKAAEIYEYMVKHYDNQLWMQSLAARCYFEAGDLNKSFAISQNINRQRQTIDTLLLEARIHRKKQNFGIAIDLLENAKEKLQTKETLWN